MHTFCAPNQRNLYHLYFKHISEIVVFSMCNRSLVADCSYVVFPEAQKILARSEFAAKYAVRMSLHDRIKMRLVLVWSISGCLECRGLAQRLLICCQRESDALGPDGSAASDSQTE